MMEQHSLLTDNKVIFYHVFSNNYLFKNGIITYEYYSCVFIKASLVPYMNLSLPVYTLIFRNEFICWKINVH